jgi:hypothetical protein
MLTKTTPAIRPLSQIRLSVKPFGVCTLLGQPESNPKIEKNKKAFVLTFPLHLAPATLSGFEVCPKRTAGCTNACLHTAGNPVYFDHKERARIARTRLFFLRRELFLELLRAEIDAAFRKVDRINQTSAEEFAAGFRLNATSDLSFERIGRGSKAFGAFSVVEYILHRGGVAYDYTKNPNRTPPQGYHLTFSLAENNDADAVQWLKGGGTVAIVFNVKRGGRLPVRFPLGGKWFCVIDGDVTDYRPSDPRGVLVGLRAKGDAKGDDSGFVRNAAEGVF